MTMTSLPLGQVTNTYIFISTFISPITNRSARMEEQYVLNVILRRQWLHHINFMFNYGVTRKSLLRQEGKRENKNPKLKIIVLFIEFWLALWIFYKTGRFIIILKETFDCNGARTHNHLVRKQTLIVCEFESRFSHLNFKYRAMYRRFLLSNFVVLMVCFQPVNIYEQMNNKKYFLRVFVLIL